MLLRIQFGTCSYRLCVGWKVIVGLGYQVDLNIFQDISPKFMSPLCYFYTQFIIQFLNSQVIINFSYVSKSILYFYNQTVTKSQQSYLSISPQLQTQNQQLSPIFTQPLIKSFINKMQSLLKILQTILRSYSRLSIQQLFQNNLAINIFLIPNMDIARQVLNQKFPTIRKAKQHIFLKGDHQFKKPGNQSFGRKEKPVFIYLTVNHPKMLSLHKQILSKKQSQNQPSNFVQNLICLTVKDHIIDNILQLEQKQNKQFGLMETKAFFFKVYEQKGMPQIINQLALFLSIYQFYHSHTGLVLSLHEINNFQVFDYLTKLSQQDFSQDDDELLTCSQYCRIFQAAPFKIANQEIAFIADIQSYFWGEKVRIEQGNDGILFWFLFDRHPLIQNEGNSLGNVQEKFKFMNILNSQKSFIQKSGLKLGEEKFSHLLLRSKSLIKQPLQNLCLTIVILNVKKMKNFDNLNRIYSEIFEKQVKRLCQKRAQQKQFQICEKSSQEIQRLSELLTQISYSRQSFEDQNQKVIKKETQELVYNINRWLYLKNKE